MADTLGEIIVEFVTKGFGLTQTQIDQTRKYATAGVQAVSKAFQGGQAFAQGLAASIDSLGNRISAMGTRASIAFAAMQAGILKAVSSADPTGWKMFTTQLEILSLHVGRIFIPILRDLTKWVHEVAMWFKNLSQPTRQLIVEWTRFAAVALVVVAVGSKLGGILLGMVAGVVSMTASVLGLVGSLFSSIAAWAGFTVAEAVAAIATSVLTGGIWAVVMAIAALVAGLAVITAGLALAVAGFFVLGQQGDTLGQKLMNAWKAVWSVLKPFVDAMLRAVDRLTASWRAFATVFGEIAQQILGTFGTDWQGALAVATAAFDVFLTGITNAVEIIEGALIGLVTVVRQVVMAIQQIGNSIEHTINAARAVLARNFKLAWQEEVKAAKSAMKAMQDINNIPQAMAVEVGKFGAEANKPVQHKLENNTPMVFEHKPELIGISEAMRRAQTATQNDPRLALQKEQLELQKQALEQQKQIAINTAKPNVKVGMT